MSTVSAYCELSVTAYDRSGTDAGRERTKQRGVYFKVTENGLLNLNRRERERGTGQRESEDGAEKKGKYCLN